MGQLRGRAAAAARAALCIVAAAALAGCAGAAATPLPAVTVHVLNLTSNVVVTAVDLHPEGVVGTAPSDGYGFVAPCGSEVELRATIEHDRGGDLGLLIDARGELDRFYPSGDIEPASAFMFELSIIWSDGELNEGDWITVMPTEVVRSGGAVASPPPAGGCAPWSYREY